MEKWDRGMKPRSASTWLQADFWCPKVGCCSWTIWSSCSSSTKTEQQIPSPSSKINPSPPFTAYRSTCKSLFVAQGQSLAPDSTSYVSIQSWHAPSTKQAAPSRKTAETPPIPHRFVSTKDIYCCGRKNKENRETVGDKVSIPRKTRSFSLPAGWAGLGDQPRRLPPPPRLLLGTKGTQHSRLRQVLCLLRWKETQARHRRRDLRAAFPPSNQYLKLQWKKTATCWYEII